MNDAIEVLGWVVFVLVCAIAIAFVVWLIMNGVYVWAQCGFDFWGGYADPSTICELEAH